MEVVLSIKELYAETRAFLDGKAVSGGLESPPSPPPEGPMPSAGGSRTGDGPCPLQLDSPQEEEALHGPLNVLGQELQRLLDIHWLGPIAHPAEEVGAQGLGKGTITHQAAPAPLSAWLLAGKRRQCQQGQLQASPQHPQAQEGQGQDAKAEDQQRTPRYSVRCGREGDRHSPRR